MLIDVYCHTSPSGKRYVGYSRDGMSSRWREHAQEAAAGSDRLLCRAIRKYGAGAFRHELLEQCDTEAGAKRAEIRWIASRRTQAPAGYNATAGGEGIAAACPEVRAKLCAAWTPERKAANGERMRRQNVGNAFGAANKGLKRTPETRTKMAAKARGQSRHVTPHTDESKARMSQSHCKRFEDPTQRHACGNGTRGKPWSAARRAAQERRG